MGKIKQNKFSGNQYWTNLLWQVHKSNIVPLSGPKYLWDARFPSSIILNDGLVDQWIDLYQNLPLYLYFGEDLSKAPTYESSTVLFNGANNYLAAGLNESTLEFTFIIVTSNLRENLAENTGTIAWLDAGGVWNADYINVMAQLGFTANNTQLGVFESYPIQAIVIQSLNNGTQANVWVNGGISSNAAVSGTNPPFFLQIGSQLAQSYLFGSIPWLAYYDSAISNIEIDNALTYLSEAFNIPVSPVA